MENHLAFIRRAIELAASSRARGDEPFGAILVLNGVEILAAKNTARLSGDPTNHAEMNLIREAFRKISPQMLCLATLYSSTEPCPMCTGGIFWAGIRRIAYSTPSTELAVMASDPFLLPCRILFERGKEKTEVIGPLLPEEGRVVHEGFWIDADAKKQKGIN